jgi:hypothetical protein
MCRCYRVFRSIAHPFFLIDDMSNAVISKSQALKSCVLGTNTSDGITQNPVYYGNYAASKLLLSRFSWRIQNKTIFFHNFTVKSAYQSMLTKCMQSISAIDKWETKINFPIRNTWKNMIAYHNDRILNNKTKEKLYKIYTRAFPLFCRMKVSGTISGCPFCGGYENEMHCFVQYSRLMFLWRWVADILARPCPWIPRLTEAEFLFGYSETYSKDKFSIENSFMQKQFESYGFQDVGSTLITTRSILKNLKESLNTVFKRLSLYMKPILVPQLTR